MSHHRPCCVCCNQTAVIEMTITGMNATLCSCAGFVGGSSYYNFYKLDSIAFDGTYYLSFVSTYMAAGQRYCVYRPAHPTVSAIARRVPDGSSTCVSSAPPLTFADEDFRVVFNRSTNRVVEIMAQLSIGGFGWTGSDVIGAAFANQYTNCSIPPFAINQGTIATAGAAALHWM